MLKALKKYKSNPDDAVPPYETLKDVMNSCGGIKAKNYERHTRNIQ